MQYGYHISEKKVKENIRALIDVGCEKVFVETDESDKVIGYIHVAPYKLLYFKPLANILGLLVDEKRRRMGMAENWSRNKKMGTRE